MQQFIGIVHKGEDTDYGICFPDFIGCISAGSTMEELLTMAHEALQGHINVMHEYGDPLPEKPMPFDAVAAHELAEDAMLFVTINAQLPTKSKRINIMMDEHLLQDIRAVTNNRSAFLAEAARAYLRHYSHSHVER